MKFRKKPVVIDAYQWNGMEGPDNWPEWLRASKPLYSTIDCEPIMPKIALLTLEGVMYAQRGDWIVRGIKGEVYPVKPDIFAATYEAVDV